MEKRAVVLAGGGSRGGYQIGVWKALAEIGLDFQVVTGTSVGALNGALMAQGDYDRAVELWENVSNEQIMKKVPEFQDADGNVHQFGAVLRELVRSGGIDVGPLEKLVREVVDEDKLRASQVNFGLVTVQYPNLTPVKLTKEEIPQGMLADYLLASAACFPAFKPYAIGDKAYIDGGYGDNMPVELAIRCGADRIIAVDLEGLGLVHRYRGGKVKIRTIKSHWDLGPFLYFEPSLSRRNVRLGYLDCLKEFGHYEGMLYAFEKGECGRNSQQIGEKIRQLIVFAGSGGGKSLLLSRQIQRTVIKSLTARFRRAMGFIRLVTAAGEIAGECLEIDPMQVYTFDKFNWQLQREWNHFSDLEPSHLRKALNQRFGGSKMTPQKKRLEQLARAYQVCRDGLKTGELKGLVPLLAQNTNVVAAAVYLIALEWEGQPRRAQDSQEKKFGLF